MPEVIRRGVERELAAFCERRVPAHIRHEVRLVFGFRGDSAMLYEERPPWRPERGDERWCRMPIARFRYDSDAGLWTLYWADRNGRWRVYDEVEPVSNLSVLVAEVDADPCGAFWG